MLAAAAVRTYLELCHKLSIEDRARMSNSLDQYASET